MNLRQKLYEQQQQRAQLVKAAGELLAKGDLEGWKGKSEEAKALNPVIQALEDQIAQEDQAGVTDGEPVGKTGKPGLVKDQGPQDAARKAFFEAARKGFPKVTKASGDQLQEGVDADGGYIVPKDIQTRINHYVESHQSLLSEVRRETVTTQKGSRTFRTRAAHPGFATVAEAAKIPKQKGPTFELLEYNIEKRSGYLPVTNELMADTDAALEAELVSWFGEEAIATANKEIVTELKKNSATDLKDLDGIIKAWVGLGSALRDVSKLYTNDNGLAWLGTLKDKNDRYLLTPNPADPKQLQLCVGPHILPVKVYDNDVLPNDVAKVPMVVGSLNEGIMYWDRQHLTIVSSTTATVGTINAFEQDMTIWKGSLRDDCTQRDKKAYVNGYITPAGSAGP